MRFSLFLIIAALFFKGASAIGYRHVGINKKRETSFYISLGVLFPYNSQVKNISFLKLDQIDENSRLFDLILDSDNQTPVVSDILKKETGSSMPFEFNRRRIGAGVNLGYKSAYLWRTDFSVDFSTVTRTILLPRVHWDSFDISGEIPRFMDFTFRQFAFLGNFFIDLDNPTNFTPFIGVGAGFSTNQAYIQLVADQVYREPDTSLISNFYFTYEVKWGFRLGTRKAFTNIEIYKRRTPKVEYTTKGVRFNFGFRI